MNSEVKVISIILAITAVVIIGGLTLTKNKTASDNKVQVQSGSLLSTTTPIFVAGADSKTPTQATQNQSQISIVEFGDFACPACAMLAPNLKKALADYGDQVSFALRIIPIHGEESIKSAIAAYAAGEQNKFYAMAEILFANQEAWAGKNAAESRDLFIGYAKTIGLDVNKFTSRIDSADFRVQVKSMIDVDSKDATLMNIHSTPTLIINGKTVIVGVQSTETFKKIIDAELGVK